MLKKVLLFVLLTSTNLLSNIESVRIKIGGMVNEYGTTGIAKRLSQIKGIKSVNVTKNGIATINLSEDNKFNLALLKPAIEHRTKYRIKSMRVTAIGKIERKNKFYALDFEQIPHKIYLTEVKYKTIAVAENSSSNAFIRTTGNIYRRTMDFFKNIRNATKEKFSKTVRMHCKHNVPVRFTGYVHRQADGSYWLSKASAKIKEIDDESDLVIEELKV